MRLDDAEPKGSLRQFLAIDWRARREAEYQALLAACRMAERPTAEGGVARAAHDAAFLARLISGHIGAVNSVACSPDGRHALSGSDDQTVRLWEVGIGRQLRVLEGHTGGVKSVAWSPDGRRALSGSVDHTVRLWEVETGRQLRVLEGHTDSVWSVAWSPDSRRALSGSADKTVRLWEVEIGRQLRVLKGHTASVWSLAWSPDGRRVLSGSHDHTVRLWEVETGRQLRVLEGHTGWVRSVAWSPDGRRAASAAENGVLRLWDLEALVAAGPAQEPELQYTNAKVLLVGDTGAGKTGLAQRLALGQWEKSDSTVGAWSTQWKLPEAAAPGVEREIWLWDFGGQADQRLIHQLYMDVTAVAVLVFDPQKEDLFDGLGQWDRDLARAARRPFQKLLVAGRIDAGGLRANRAQVEKFAQERGFGGYLETSAKEDRGCQDLKRAIVASIRWDDIPWRTSPLLFKRLKDEMVRLKDEGKVLLRFGELRQHLELRLGEERFTDAELKTVISLLAGPCVVWELGFGAFVLLQPELINAYGQAVVQTIRESKQELGYIDERRVLDGDLTWPAALERLPRDDEQIVLLAMHQTFLERGLCLREPTGSGTLLIFPSYYRRERPDLEGHPAVFVSYQFDGFLDDVYATLVVRLHHTKPFERDELWRYAADFKTQAGQRLGIKLTRRAEGAGELELYFDPQIPMDVMVIFSKYVHEHLLAKARDVVRLRHYVCPHCGTPVENRATAMKRLDEGKKHILCVDCERQVPLWDALEEQFASPEIQRRVRELEEQARIRLDNESKERALVGEVIATVALAGQIAREFSVSDHGIDMEIEFKDDAGRATGRRLYLQLKSGDSHLQRRKRDEEEVFAIKEPRHATYWQQQPSPVWLVVRTSEGNVRWMDVGAALKEATAGGNPPRQVVFTGERFDVMSVRRLRERVLAGSVDQPGATARTT